MGFTLDVVGELIVEQPFSKAPESISVENEPVGLLFGVAHVAL